MPDMMTGWGMPEKLYNSASFSHLSHFVIAVILFFVAFLPLPVLCECDVLRLIYNLNLIS